MRGKGEKSTHCHLASGWGEKGQEKLSLFDREKRKNEKKKRKTSETAGHQKERNRNPVDRERAEKEGKKAEGEMPSVWSGEKKEGEEGTDTGGG